MMRRRTFLAGTAAAIGLGGLEPAAAATRATPLHTLDFAGVRLLPSRWRSQQDLVAEEYARVPSDDYLRGFRLRAGLPAPGRELGGWYSQDLFHDFGQIMSGLARLYAATGRAGLKDKVAELVHGFAECIEPDGYFFYSRQPNSVHYVYDKMVCGLLDASLYCAVEEALPALERITTWAADPAHLTRAREHAGGWEGEWYTLSENLYRAHLATGDPTYRDFGAVWEYRSLWDRFYAGEDFFQTPDGRPVASYHAYSHVNSLSGLGAGHRVTGDLYYLTALRNAYDVIRRTQCWSTGGYGPYEQLMPDRSAIAGTLQPWHHHFETQCGSWAALKVSKYLVTATGQARYGDWAEQMLYNGVGASGPMGPDGTVLYYSAYSPRGGRKRNIAPWSCCTGTRPQGVADYTDQVFLAGDDRLLVNLFLPAQVRLRSGLAARLLTDFPASDRVRLEIDAAPARACTLGFRSPGWLAGAAALSVNGVRTRVDADPDGWLTTTRTWRRGDRIEAELPMSLELQRFLPDREAPAAVTFGPVSVAYAGTVNPVRDRSAADLVGRTRRVGPDLRWQAGALTARPFYAFGLGERYFLHLDPAAGLYIQQDGDWGSLPFVSVTGVAGDSATCEFDGPTLRYSWYEFDSAGIVAVEVDGVPRPDVDLYGPASGTPRSTELTGFGPGRHTIRLVNSGRKNPLSTGITINIIDLVAGAAGARSQRPAVLSEAELAQVEGLKPMRRG